MGISIFANNFELTRIPLILDSIFWDQRHNKPCRPVKLKEMTEKILCSVFLGPGVGCGWQNQNICIKMKNLLVTLKVKTFNFGGCNGATGDGNL